MADTEGTAETLKQAPGSKSSSPVWDYFTIVCNMCNNNVHCPKSGTSDMISHLQNFHPEEYWEMLLQTSQKIKAESKASLDMGKLRRQYQENKMNQCSRPRRPKKGISSEEVEEALNHAKNVRPMVKIEEDFESEEEQDTNDMDNVADITAHHDGDLTNLSPDSEQNLKAFVEIKILKNKDNDDADDNYCDDLVDSECDDNVDDPDFKLEGHTSPIPCENPKPDRKRPSLLWEYFTSMGECLTLCNLCSAQVQCPRSSTSDMLLHLQDSHSGEYEEMLMKTTQKVKAEAKASTDIEELKKLYEETKKSGGSLELEALRKTGQRESSVTKSSSLDVAELKKQYEVNKEKNIPRYLNPNLKPLKPRKPGKTYAEKKLARTARWKNYQCESCGKIFDQKEPWARHMQKHIGEPGIEIPEYKKREREYKKWQCHLCAWHGWEARKYYHMAVKHEVFLSNKFPCDICGKFLWAKCELRDHMRTHTGEKAFQCTHCGKSYANRHSKTRCERQCTGASFDCTHCDKKFFMKAQLLTHERLHTGEKPFACKFCDSSYPSSSSLKKHVTRHHTS